MAGFTVSRELLDMKAGEAVLHIREAFENADIVNSFLKQNPSNGPDGDLLTKPVEDGGFGYTADEAYLIRVVFEGFDALNVEPILEMGSKLTGLS